MGADVGKMMEGDEIKCNTQTWKTKTCPACACKTDKMKNNFLFEIDVIANRKLLLDPSIRW